MRTIAEEAGVHVSTVSRALRREPGEPDPDKLSDTTRRVRDVARRLGYLPDPYAAGLRSGRSNVIGVLVPRLADVALANLYEGIETAVTARGYQSVVATTRDDPEEQQHRLTLMLQRRVDALIIADASRHGGYVDEIAERGVPFVLVSRRYADYVAVTCDDELGGRLVGTHLVDLGHEVIAITGGWPYTSTDQDRITGARTAVRERGYDIPDERILLTGVTGPDGRAAAEQLLAMTPRPTAIFALSDWAAIGVMGALRDHGLVPGVDIAVVGFNDISVSADLPIPLTTVRNPIRDMGERAGQMIVDRLEGRPIESVQLQPRLVVRQSTDARMTAFPPLVRPG